MGLSIIENNLVSECRPRQLEFDYVEKILSDGRKYYKIDEKITIYGTYELWEDMTYGDLKPCAIVKENTNIIVGRIFDSLLDWVIEMDRYNEFE